MQQADFNVWTMTKHSWVVIVSCSLWFGLEGCLGHFCAWLAVDPCFRKTTMFDNQKEEERRTRKKVEWKARMIGTLHAIIVIQGACRALSMPELLEDRIRGYNDHSLFYSSVATGYFLWDTIRCFQHYSVFGFAFTLHAVFCLAAYFGSLVTPTLQYYAMTFLLFELSTPFIHVAWWANRMGCKNQTFCLIHGIATVFVFAGTRCAWGVWKIWELTKDLAVLEGFLPRVFMVIAITMTVLNFVWLGMIVSFLRRGLPHFDWIFLKPPSPSPSTPFSTAELHIGLCENGIKKYEWTWCSARKVETRDMCPTIDLINKFASLGWNQDVFLSFRRQTFVGSLLVEAISLWIETKRMENRQPLGVSKISVRLRAERREAKNGLW